MREKETCGWSGNRWNYCLVEELGEERTRGQEKERRLGQLAIRNGRVLGRIAIVHVYLTSVRLSVYIEVAAGPTERRNGDPESQQNECWMPQQCNAVLHAILCTLGSTADNEELRMRLK